MAPTHYGNVSSFSSPTGFGKVIYTANNYNCATNVNVKRVEARLDRLPSQIADLTAVMSQKEGGSKIYCGELRKVEKELQELERISRVQESTETILIPCRFRAHF